MIILQDQFVSEQSKNNDSGPLIMNAFEMITLSQGLNLSALFDRRQVLLHIWLLSIEDNKLQHSDLRSSYKLIYFS